MVKPDELKCISAEREILGSILTKPEDLHKVTGIIRTDDFYRLDYRVIYETCAGMILAGHTPDVVNLPEELIKNGTLDKAGGLSNVMDIGSVGRCYNLSEKAQIVAAYSRRRRLIDKARELAVIASDMGQDIDSSAATFANELLANCKVVEERVGDMQMACFEFLATLEQRKSGSMMETGIQSLDRYLIGLEPGQLIVIAGRPGHGKTALAGTIAVNLAKAGKKILICSMEMSKAELAARFLSRAGKIPGDKLKRPQDMTDAERQALHDAMEKLSELPITIDERGHLSPADVAAEAKRMQQVNGLDCLIIDYLQLMHSGRTQDQSRVQEVSFITRELKGLSKNLGIPVVVLSQLSRANVKDGSRPREPRLSDLRDSGSIEQDCDVCLLLHRAENPNEENGSAPFLDGIPTELIIGKNRSGRVGKITLDFRDSFGTFADAEVVPMSARQSNRIDQMLA